MTPYLEGIEILSPRAGFLDRSGANFTSQFGEDGLIGAAIAHLGIANQWCFEVGAADGVFLSNTKRLRDDGWQAVLIEADDEHYQKLRQLASEEVRTVHRKIDRFSLDAILAGAGAPENLDLAVIDIDGQDWWIWNGLADFRPRLMLIEFDYKSEDKGVFIPGEGCPGQASYEAILQLGAALEYEALAKTRCNLLFADRAIL